MQPRLQQGCIASHTAQILFKGSEENAMAVVLLAVVLAGLLNTYLSGLVVGARAAHGVALPFMCTYFRVEGTCG